jgi:hypothetical protein
MRLHKKPGRDKVIVLRDLPAQQNTEKAVMRTVVVFFAGFVIQKSQTNNLRNNKTNRRKLGNYKIGLNCVKGISLAGANNNSGNNNNRTFERRVRTGRQKSKKRFVLDS